MYLQSADDESESLLLFTTRNTRQVPLPHHHKTFAFCTFASIDNNAEEEDEQIAQQESLNNIKYRVQFEFPMLYICTLHTIMSKYHHHHHQSVL